MAFNQFTNLDFQDLRTQIKDYLRSNSNFTDFDFEGSNFSVLIDNLAYNSYITAYNTNMAVNEAFIDSATVRENVVSLARNIGYVPRSKRSAVAKISFTVDTSNIAARYVTLNAGIVALGNIQNGSFKFSIPEKITVSPASNGVASFQNIEIFEGNYLTKEFQVVSSQLDAKYILPNTNIDTTSIRVSVTDGDTGTIEVYNAYENIFQVNSESRLFLIQEVNDEKYQILFGDGVLGKKPPNGSTIKVSYIVTNITMHNKNMRSTSMKCMMSVDRKHIRRVTDEKASQMYEEGWRYVSKSMWKEQVRDVESSTENKTEKGKSNKMSKAEKRHLRKKGKQ